jgi:hypothetical protein
MQNATDAKVEEEYFSLVFGRELPGKVLAHRREIRARAVQDRA